MAFKDLHLEVLEEFGSYAGMKPEYFKALGMRVTVSESARVQEWRDLHPQEVAQYRRDEKARLRAQRRAAVGLPETATTQELVAAQRQPRVRNAPTGPRPRGPWKRPPEHEALIMSPMPAREVAARLGVTPSAVNAARRAKFRKASTKEARYLGVGERAN